jgi:hypothetical protein
MTELVKNSTSRVVYLEREDITEEMVQVLIENKNIKYIDIFDELLTTT